MTLESLSWKVTHHHTFNKSAHQTYDTGVILRSMQCMKRQSKLFIRSNWSLLSTLVDQSIEYLRSRIENVGDCKAAVQILSKPDLEPGMHYFACRPYKHIGRCVARTSHIDAKLHNVWHIWILELRYLKYNDKHLDSGGHIGRDGSMCHLCRRSISLNTG